MNDLDDIRRAIDDDVYSHGKLLEPTDRVRRAIGRRRTLNRVAVAGTSALVAAAAVVAVTLIRPNGHEGSIGTPTTNTTATGPIALPTSTGLMPTPSLTGPVSSESPSPTGGETPTSASTTGAGLPTGGVSGLLAAVQWHGTYGALVAVDPVTGAVVYTYTTGITNPSYDVLRYANDAYFVSKTDGRGCATEWTGIDLVTGNPTAVPAALTDHPIESAAISTSGNVVTSVGGCGSDPTMRTYNNGVSVSGGGRPLAAAARLIALSGDSAVLAYVESGPSTPQTNLIRIRPAMFSMDPGFVRGQTITVPDGCTPTALAFAGQELVAGVSCQVNKALVLTVLRWDAKGALLMRKDVTTKFKEASISDVAVIGKDVYYVVNAEGTNADVYRLTEGKDVSMAADLFHIAAQP